MSAITIYVQTFSGDIIPIAIPIDSSAFKVYFLVLRALPVDIRPKSLYFLTLLSQDGREFNHSGDIFPATEGEIFYLFVQSYAKLDFTFTL